MSLYASHCWLHLFFMQIFFAATCCSYCNFLLLCRNGERQSGVVTKGFDVNYAPLPEILPEDDDLGFQADLEHKKSKVILLTH